MLVVLGALAFAADNPPPASPIAQVQALEWQRSDPSTFESFADDPDASVRRAAAVGLGRLRNPAALGLLEGLASDLDANVASAAREALGYTPGAAILIRHMLDADPSRAAWGVPAVTDDRRGALLRALGRQGDATDVARLTAAIAEPGADGASAADAVARLARRKVDNGAAAVPALVDCLVRIDPAVVEACAQALRRVDVSAADEATTRELKARWDQLPTGPARAWALRAAYLRMDAPERTAALTRALSDPDPLVRIAALDAAGAGDLPFPALADAHADGRAGVRSAATAAIGRTGGDNGRIFFETQVTNADAWEATEAMEARIAGGGAVDVAIATDPTGAPQLRAAAIASVRDASTLVTLASDVSPLVRSAAAGRLAELGTAVSPKDALAMLAHEDFVVRQAAIEILTAHEARTGANPVAFVPALILQLRTDTDPDALAAGFTLLAERARKRPGDVDVRDNVLKASIARGLSSADLPVREAAAHLAKELKYTPGPVDRRVDFPVPDAGQAVQIRSARVITNRGELRIELWPEVAPVAVWNFARLAESNFFDGVVFHRVVPGFVIQTGDQRGDGSGGPGYTLPDEVSDRPFATGGVGMARSTAFDTGGSQWFVTTSPQPSLVGDYTQFGQVTDGMRVAKQIRRGDVVLDVIIERNKP